MRNERITSAAVMGVDAAGVAGYTRDDSAGGGGGGAGDRMSLSDVGRPPSYGR